MATEEDIETKEGYEPPHPSRETETERANLSSPRAERRA